MSRLFTYSPMRWIGGRARPLASLTVAAVFGGIVCLISLYGRKHPGAADEIARDWWDGWWWQS